MFGSIRLALAFLVAYSHIGGTIFSLNPGVFAVVVFFIISGYVVCSLIGAGLSLKDFYIDRILRIVPSYFFVLSISFFYYIFQSPDDVYFLSKLPTIWDYLGNFFIFPLNFYMFSGIDQFSFVPQAWSLGLELQFYIVAPALCMFSVRFRLLSLSISYCIWILAITGNINSDIWGYRLLPGTLFMFLTGIAIYKEEKIFISILLILTSILLLLLTSQLIIRSPFNIEVVLGFLTGTIFISVFRNFKRNKIDSLFGEISYPFFLVHFILIWILPKNFKSDLLLLNNLLVITTWFVLVFLFSGMIYFFIDRPIGAYRRSRLKA